MVNSSILKAISSTKYFADKEYDDIVKDSSKLVKIMDEADIEKIGLISYQSPAVIGTTNEYIKYIAKYTSEYRDRLVQIGSANPIIDENPTRTLEWQYSDLEIRILKLHPVHQLFKPNAYRKEEGNLRRLKQIYEFAVDHRIPVMVHTGTSVFPGAGLKYGDPIFLDDVGNDFPNLQLIMCHAGRPIWMDTALVLMRKHPNMLIDASGIPPKRILEYLPRLEEIQDRVLFGSDWPSPGVKGIQENKEEFETVKISDGAKRKILYDNAWKLFGK
jgi:predicted TIM-barrel fold metal-dependent hydrolase